MAKLSSSKGERVRAQILQIVHAHPEFTLAQIGEEIGLPNPAGIFLHIEELKTEGLMILGKRRALTPAAIAMMCYMDALNTPQSLFEVKCMEFLGGIGSSERRAVQKAAELIDENYTWGDAKKGGGLFRKVRSGGDEAVIKKEVERKAMAQEIIEACKTCDNAETVCKEVGLVSGGGFRSRIDAIFKRAAIVLEMNLCDAPKIAAAHMEENSTKEQILTAK